MRTRTTHLLRRPLTVGVATAAVALLTACTGRGGGTLPPSPGFTGDASFGFSFSCEDAGGTNPPEGTLRIELAYTDRGRSLIGAGFSVHGTVDDIDPVLESEICIGQNPPPGGNELIFLGRYRPTGPAPALFPTSCASRGAPPCRFEVVVRDNDQNGAPSRGDFFQIALSSATAVTSELNPATVFYTRAGTLRSGNLTVD